MHDTQLLATIAGGLTAAFIGGYVARRLGLPVIVGYLIAGMAIGPFTPGFVADQNVATQLAELGVILLMFGVGLHFSLADLWSVRAIAIPGAAGQIAIGTSLGTLLGLVLGWELTEALVLGLALSVASTVVLIRALTERRELETSQGRIALGWLIVQDLYTILILVMLPTAALMLGTRSDGSGVVDVAVVLGKAALLVVLMYVVGGRVFPRLLLSVAREGSRELFTLAVLAAAIGIAFVSYAVFGVSLALGAFLAGAVLAESDLSHQAASDALPLRDAFAVLFLVSVGMLVDPAFLVANPLHVAAVVVLIVCGNSLAAFGIVTVLGYPSRVAVTVGAGLAHVGEFTFIVAALGVQLGLLPAEGFQLVVAGAILSISLNPFAFRLADRIEPRVREVRLVKWLRIRGARDLTVLDPAPSRRGDRRHAIIAGFGRVGSLVAGALDRRGFGYVVIDLDRRLVERLRERGVSALYGDATNEELLEQAGIEHAAVLVLAMDDPAAAIVTLERARHANPRIEVVMRTHADRTAARLREEERVWSLTGERELGVQMARVTLRRFGISGAEVEAIAQGLRVGPAPSEPESGDRQRTRPPWNRLRAAGLRLRRRPGRLVAGAPTIEPQPEVPPASGGDPVLDTDA
ncbi:MAG: sodium:proton antiporter [Chloroflexi bacterium]|nr:sodium:proton antiporter [Chloroflexota bacterium]